MLKLNLSSGILQVNFKKEHIIFYLRSLRRDFILSKFKALTIIK